MFMDLNTLVGKLTGANADVAVRTEMLEDIAEHAHEAIFEGEGPYAKAVNRDNRPGLRQIQVDMNGDGDVNDPVDLRIIEQNPEKCGPDGDLTSTAERAANGERILQVYAGRRRWPSGMIVGGEWAKIPSVVTDALGL